MHIQTDLIEQQCETSGPADHFTISVFLLSCLTLSALPVTRHPLVVVVVLQSEGLIVSVFVDSGLSEGCRCNLERKVRMDSARRRRLGHCLVVNLTQHVRNVSKGRQQIDRQKKSL